MKDKKIKTIVEYKKLNELALYEKNPRNIDKKDFEKLKESIKNNEQYFEARPILVVSNFLDKEGRYYIVGGNMRYRACKALNIDKVPVCILPELPQEKIDEIIIRDNVNNGNWDFDILADNWDIENLIDWGIDILNEPDFEDDEKEPELKSGYVEWMYHKNFFIVQEDTVIGEESELRNFFDEKRKDRKNGELMG